MNAVDPKKILIIHGGALGDLVLFVPTLRLLRKRFPAAEIVLLGSPYSGSVLVGLPYLNRTVLAYRKTDPLVQYFRKLFELRKEGFDLLVDVHSTSRSRQQKLIIGAKHSIGMRRGGLADRLYTQVIQRKVDGHMTAEYVELIRHFSLEQTEEDLFLELGVTEAHRKRANDILEENRVSGPFAVIQPTTRGRPDHEVWPSNRFAQISDSLSSLGMHIVASSDARGIPLIEEIQSMATCPIVNLAGKTESLVLAAILERAALYFGYNTGPMHVAAAVGTPIVAIFERPGKYRPWHPRSKSQWRVVMPTEVKIGEKNLYVAETIGVEACKAAIQAVLGLDPLFEEVERLQPISDGS